MSISATAPTSFDGGTQALHSELRENIFRVGLNYRIGGNSTYTPVATANWTGLYLGGNIGAGTGRDRSPSLTRPAIDSARFNLAPDGLIGGGQIGYNWQAGNIVYGLEADFQGSTMEDNKTCLRLRAPAARPISIRSCSGLAPCAAASATRSAPSLFYATGGFAYGDVKTAINNVSFSETRTGWTVGGGIETPFTLLGLFGPNWTSTTEYLYVDLGRSSHGLLGGATRRADDRHAGAHLPHRPELSLQHAGGREILIATASDFKAPAFRRGFSFVDAQNSLRVMPDLCDPSRR